jgi:hypothetical protein
VAEVPTYDPATPFPGATPGAEPVAVAVLRRMLPGVVNIALPERNGDASLPLVRVTSIGDASAPRAEERTPVFQVDVWADDYDEAESLAVFLAAAWPRIRDIDADKAYVSGAWVEAQPIYQTTPQEAEPPRFRLSLGLRIHPPRSPQ